MQDQISPDQFLFQRLVIESLDHCKKNIKVAPFQDMNIQQLVSSNKKQRIDLYHQYFLIGIAHAKTKQLVTKNYQRLIRDNLINKDHLPPQMISSILNARSNAGSTASSGSVVGSTSHLNIDKSVHVGKLISTIICSTLQPSSQITTGLNFMLEGTRSKNYGSFFYSLIEDVHKALQKARQKPMDRFLSLFMGHVVDEVEFHHEDIEFAYRNRKLLQKNDKLCVHNENSESKFGKCFICDKDAKNYDKLLFVPLCSIDCKNKLKKLNQQCIMNDHFNLFNWLMDILPLGDDITYELLRKEIIQVHLSHDKINTILNYINSTLTLEYAGTLVQTNTLVIFSHLVSKYNLIVEEEYFEKVKVFIIEIIRIIEQTPITIPTAQPRLYLLETMINLFQIEDVMTTLYVRCDCALFEFNLIERTLNALSQYAMSTEAELKEFGIKGIYKFLETLTKLPQKWNVDDLQFRRKTVEKRKKNEILTIMDNFNNENKKPQKAIIELKKIFNDEISPKNLAYLIRQNIDYQTQLKKKNTFKKDRVGEYFSVQSDEVYKTYYQFLSFIDFNGLEGDDVLRIVFNMFTLPKQGQRIERIFNALSEICEPTLGLQKGDYTYTYLYLILMTHTSNANKNVKEADKIKLQNFIKLCGNSTQKQYIRGLDDDRKVTVYNRIIDNPLENKFVYKGEQFFTKKHLININYTTQWLKEEDIPKKADPFTNMLMNIWQYIYISLVNKNNIKGLHECCYLYGRAGLKVEFEGFFSHLFKIYENEKSLSHDAMLILLKMGVDTGNYTLGISSWLSVIKVGYRLDEGSKSQIKSSDYEYEISDRLFTRTRQLHPQRLKQFFEAIVEFSSSDFKNQIGYNRQLYTLHHIAQVIEYNLSRLNLIWEEVWSTLEIYFKNICLHPRKEIAMSAIDSFKQFTMKAFKLQTGVDHGQVMDAYLHIFERSNSLMKDLIINILLNVVSKDMQSGWDSLYTILQVLDSEDKGVVMRVINRLIDDVGFIRIGNLQRLHQILVKELRIAGEENSQILERLWELSNHFNDLQIWLETLKCLKDIYKIRTNNAILQFLYRVCNHCVGMLNDNPHEVIQKQIYNEVLQVQIFITEIKNIKIFRQAIAKLYYLDMSVVLRNLGDYLFYWQKFYLTCANFQQFCYFISKYALKLFKTIQQQSSEKIAEQVCFWLSRLFRGSYPDQLLDLCNLDTDLNLGLETILHKGITSNKSELIQFSLSSKEYSNKTIIHLVVLELMNIAYDVDLVGLISGQCYRKLQQTIIESYIIGKKLNNKVMLRNFLWNNDFLKSNEENSYLPSFTKQQLRTYTIIIKYCKFTDKRINELCYGFMKQFCHKITLYLQKLTKNKNPSQLQQLIYQDLGMWISNAHHAIMHTVSQYINAIANQQKSIHSSQDLLELCMELNNLPLKKELLKKNNELMHMLIKQLY